MIESGNFESMSKGEIMFSPQGQIWYSHLTLKDLHFS